MLKVDLDYRIKDDIELILESERINNKELSERSKISRTTLDEIIKKGKTTLSVYEKFYSYIFENKYRINSVKEEILKEKYKTILFHGSKYGLSEINTDGSRDNCDFGKGFYLGETYENALAFVCETDRSSVYAFKYSLSGLKVKQFDCSMEWMLAICHYRGTLGEYSKTPKVKKIISDIEKSDVIIAPIADNKMFYIMAQFTEGEINADVALHSLSASRLGMQYIFKTDKALKKLVPIEKYYLCTKEREECTRKLNERSYEIDTKLKLAKREFKSGLYIETNY
ncbi:MAG: DUF3990 domain-containing protein [Lachnospiraceae bacterium]|nr:DUF3990 domain-containing protein [Lachnospiraceae bacterium]